MEVDVTTEEEVEVVKTLVVVVIGSVGGVVGSKSWHELHNFGQVLPFSTMTPQ